MCRPRFCLYWRRPRKTHQIHNTPQSYLAHSGIHFLTQLHHRKGIIRADIREAYT